MKKFLFFILIIFFVLIFGRRESYHSFNGKVVNIALPKENNKSSEYVLELFKAKYDTIKHSEYLLSKITFEGGYGGVSYLLGWKYDEFDPRTIDRLIIKKNDSSHYVYKLDQIDSLPFKFIDSFKVFILPVEVSEIKIVK